MSDSIGNGPFNLPDYDQFEDESFPPLPPPRSPGLEGDDPFGNGEGNLAITLTLLSVHCSYLLKLF